MSCPLLIGGRSSGPHLIAWVIIPCLKISQKDKISYGHHMRLVTSVVMGRGPFLSQGWP